MNLNWELGGVVLKNECHFRGIFFKSGNTWLLYDGMKKGLIEFNASELSMNDIISHQGEDYGIITVFYCQSNHSVNSRISVATMDNNIDDVIEHEIPIGKCNSFQSNNEYHNLKDERNYIQNKVKETNNESNAMENNVKEDGINNDTGNVDELAISISNVSDTKEKAIENIDVLTQHSNESYEKNNDEDSRSSGYIEYEKQIKSLSVHKLPYATLPIYEKDEEEHLFDDMVLRQPEPLYVGDTIEFNRFMDGYNPNKYVTGVVESIDRKGRMVAVDIGETVSTFSFIRRIIGYDSKSNTMKEQDGLIRRVQEYDLITETPSIHVGKIQTFIERCRESFQRKKRKTGELLKKSGLPSDLLR